MVFTTQPEIIAPDYSYSVMPFIRIGPSTDLRIGVAAAIDERTYNTGGGNTNAAIQDVQLVLTDSALATLPTVTVTSRTPWAPSTVDGGADTGQIVLDWNGTFTAAQLATLTDGIANVVATVRTTDGQTKVLSPWEFYLDTAGAITPVTRRVRIGGDDVTGDGSIGAPLATIGRAWELSDGDNYDIIDLEPGQSTTIAAYNDLNSAGFGWIELTCSGGTHTLTGSHSSSTGFGSHKKVKLGPGLLMSEARPGIDNGNNGGFWWHDGCTWSNPTEDGTPFSNFGVHPSRYERWYATGLTLSSHEEFNTGPTMARGVTEHNFRGDSFMKASRVKNMTIYNTRLYNVIQSGGTHSDVMQINDSATLDDVGTDHYIQTVLCNDGEPATMQLSNINNAGNYWDRACIENFMLDNDGLQGNIGEVNSQTNNNIFRRCRNILWRHCGWRLQNQRIGAQDWDHVQFQACHFANINSDNASGGTNGGQTELDNSETTFDQSVYAGTTGFTSIPGTDVTNASVAFTTTDDSQDAFSQDYTLTGASAGKGSVTGELYSGRPQGETDPGPWPSAATGDFTIAPRMAVIASGGNTKDLSARMGMTLTMGL